MGNLEVTLKNLTILRNNIEEVVTKSQLNLNMGFYRGGVHSEAFWPIVIRDLDDVNNPECGTSCCILGFCPSIPGLAAIKDDLYIDGMDYLGYSERLFPYFVVQDENWEFLFGPDNNNHIESFICRADKIIKKLQNG